MLKQHHLRHGWHQGKLGRHQFVCPMKHGKHDKRLLSVLNALSQLALYDVEVDVVVVHPQGGLRRRDLAWCLQVFQVGDPI